MVTQRFLVPHFLVRVRVGQLKHWFTIVTQCFFLFVLLIKKMTKGTNCNWTNRKKLTA